jgi:hypothetical protein
MNQPIIILGMHRSGTSLLTKILQQIGVNIGKDIDDNYESQFFVKLNEWAFFQAGATWDNPLNMNFLTDDFSENIAQNFKKHLHKYKFSKNFANYKKLSQSNVLWAWKDPRNTFTYPIWQKIFPEAKFINIYRNPIDVAESLRTREEIFQKTKFSQTKTGIKKRLNEYFLTRKRLYSQSIRVLNIEEGIKLWEEYTSKALSINNNIIHISYENFLENPEEFITKISNFIDYKSVNYNFNSLKNIVDKNRKFAFLNDEELIKKYNIIKNTELLKKLNYDKII